MSILNALRCSYGALRLLAGLSRIINPFCRRFDRERNAAVRAAAALPPGRLNGQGLGTLASLPYGAWNMGNNGCEVIAVYNALLVLRRPVPLPEIAASLERRGLLFNGYGGTNLSAMAAFLREKGVSVTVLRRRERARYDAALDASGCAILSYWTGAKLRDADGSWNTLHTVSVQRGFAGVEICNWASNWPAPHSARSVEEFLRREGGEPVCLLALNTNG
jgi:hypothetical protein